MARADQRPLASHLIQPAQQKLLEFLADPDLAEYRLRDDLSPGILLVAAFRPQLAVHTPLGVQIAATSIPLNIAEGAGEFAAAEKARFYRMAKRSATECAAILDVCRRIDALTPGAHNEARGLLLRVVSMLTKLSK